MWGLCGISGQPRLEFVAFSHYFGPAQATPAALPAASRRNSIAGRQEHSSCIRPVAMPGRFRLDDRVTCVRNNNAMGKRHPGKISKVRRTVRIIDGVAVPVPHCSTAHPAHSSICAQVTEGLSRDHSSNHYRYGGIAVGLCCWIDTLTGGASKPDDMWYYSIKYDDGEEEHKVGPGRIFPDK